MRRASQEIDLTVFAVVIPEEGSIGGLGPHQTFFGYDTDYKILLYCLHRLYSVVGDIPSEGLAGWGPPKPSLGMSPTTQYNL